MTKRHAEFLTSAPTLAHCPALGDTPEIAFVGRSNVGKSSIINALLGRKNLAQTSNTPGKTRLMNYYLINQGELAFVDLPGYGYAKVSKSEQNAWQRHLEAYLKKRETLALVILLIDSRHGPKESDAQMLTWLQHQGLATQVVLTKWDKLKQKEQHGMLEASAAALHLPDDAVLVASAQTKKGVDALWQRMKGVLA